MEFDRLHDLKNLPPIPCDHDEKAALIHAAICELSALIRTPSGTPAIMNPNANDSDVCATLHRVAASLKLANIAAAEPGKLDESRLVRDLAFIRAAFMRHHDEGTCEIDHPVNPLHAPAHVSAADDLEDAGGAYVAAWVWVDLEDVDSGMLEDAAHDLEPKPAI